MRFLFEINKSSFIKNPVTSSVTIILTVTIIIWDIIRKMTSQNSDASLDAPIIRAFIISRGADGATLTSIKSKF